MLTIIFDPRTQQHSELTRYSAEQLLCFPYVRALRRQDGLFRFQLLPVRPLFWPAEKENSMSVEISTKAKAIVRGRIESKSNHNHYSRLRMALHWPVHTRCILGRSYQIAQPLFGGCREISVIAAAKYRRIRHWQSLQVRRKGVRIWWERSTLH